MALRKSMALSISQVDMDILEKSVLMASSWRSGKSCECVCVSACHGERFRAVFESRVLASMVGGDFLLYVRACVTRRQRSCITEDRAQQHT